MLAPLMPFETSTTKNLFRKCCYLYISIILLILEVVFQFFLRLIRMVQYSKPWAIAYVRVTITSINQKLLYICNGFPFVQMLGVCFMFQDQFPIIFVLFCSVDGGHSVVFEVTVKCEDDPYLCILEKRKREHFLQGTIIRVRKIMPLDDFHLDEIPCFLT